MAGKYSNTATNFTMSSTFKDEEYIRQLVQNQVFIIFQDIKTELEIKIKSIDKNINQIRNDVKKIYEQKKITDLTQIFQKIQKIQAQMQILKYHQQNSIKISRTKSLDKDRKPIFKRQDGQNDFSSVILGLESKSVIKSDNINSERSIKQSLSKPPLPKQSPKTSKISQKILQKEQKRIFKRNPVLDSSASIHRWLHQNNDRQFSCFSSVIREEQIEESIYI